LHSVWGGTGVSGCRKSRSYFEGAVLNARFKGAVLKLAVLNLTVLKLRVLKLTVLKLTVLKLVVLKGRGFSRAVSVAKLKRL
jgi:hypothetical protein